MSPTANSTMTATLSPRSLFPSMAGSKAVASRAVTSPRTLSRSKPGTANAMPRMSLQDQIGVHESAARRAAEQGAIAECAQQILAALDCERRLANTGPQVLQLIKPRN
ncbi:MULTISPECIES: hypothetical protein [Aphanothece]|uniref:hypothetical protein n=1 Tax=Aphanothece TaxID=1121 RepID=UPI00398ECADB